MHGNLIILVVVVLLLPQNSTGGDTLSKGESLTGSQTLTSNNGLFELGFFPFQSSTNRFYLCIRYTEFEEKTIVWVANRDKPVPDTTASNLQIASNGNLQLRHSGQRDPFWSTSSSPLSPESVVAVLGDDGNLILRDGRAGLAVTFWQSFDEPTNTWLPEAALGGVRRLVSWANDADPSPGAFSAEVSSELRIVLKWNGSVYWESGSYDADVFGFGGQALSSVSLGFKLQKQSQSDYVRLQNTLAIITDGNYHLVFSMVVMDHQDGKLRRLTSWATGRTTTWESAYLAPGPEPLCGAYALPTGSSDSPCRCLHGFRLSLLRNAVGLRCERNTSLSLPPDCGGGKDGFMEISDVKWPTKAILVGDGGDGETECEKVCLQRCSCTAYVFDQPRCLVWEGDLYGMQHQVSDNQKLHLRLASSDLPPKGGDSSKMKEVIIAVVVPVFVLLSGAFLGFFYNNRRRTKHNNGVTTNGTENKEPGGDLLSFDFEVSFNSTLRNMEFDLPMFSYSSVSAATNNFSPDNKLGEGGFGPVYKGKLLNGQEMAIKRLSQKSGQGFEEFRNEILLIAKLQHRNLVRILGCCIDPNESILIYEYMPNKSLDLFLFGSGSKLDWETRIRIVEGIAQGLLYLHEYSRVRVIHRDLKASNILLDDEMNPKISDFGMARIFGGTESQAHTNRVVGTFGYLAPEYAMEGLFSIKSDVYSFGVLVLEIISGKKNTGFYKTDSLHLLGHAWDLWISGRGVEVVDDKVGATVAASTALRYINVGLLCVQENPNERPNMSSVISMLSSETAALPQPKKPAFSTTSLISSSSSKTKSGEDSCASVSYLTVSDVVPR